MSLISIYLPKLFLKWLPQPLVITIKSELSPELAARLSQIDTKLMKQSEALAALGVASDKLSEASTEILAKLAELANTDPDLSPEGAAIVAAITSKAQALADIVPNPAPEP